jgi:hypothetical protein
MGKFPVKFFESVANNLKFENLPVAHRQYGALRVSILQFYPATPPVERLSSLLKNKRK